MTLVASGNAAECLMWTTVQQSLNSRRDLQFICYAFRRSQIRKIGFNFMLISLIHKYLPKSQKLLPSAVL